MSGKTVQLLNAIETGIKEEFGSDIKSVELHGGRFSIDELKKVSRNAPAIYYGLLKLVKPKEFTCNTDRDAMLVASVITKDKPQLSRHISVIDISERLSDLIIDNNWGLDFVDQQDEVTVQNFYSNKISTIGVAIYGLSWTQQVRLD